MYSYLSDLSKGYKDPQPLTDNEVNEMRNLKKKVDFVKDQLDEVEAKGEFSNGSLSESDEDDFVDEAGLHKQTEAKKKGQRGGVSAEAYGKWNKKGDFKPKVIAKSAQTREQLKKRLLQAFMFNALDEKEFEIVVDSIEEVKANVGTLIIKEGDEGDCMYVVE